MLRDRDKIAEHRDLDRYESKVVIRLDNRQVAFAVVGLVAITTAIFAAGVMVGKQMGDALPSSLEEIAGLHTDGIDLEPVEEHRRRDLLLSEAGPGTAAIGAELARSPQLVMPSSPTEAARIEAHRQIAEARAGGSIRSLGPLRVGGSQPDAARKKADPPLTLIVPRPGASEDKPAAKPDSGGFTLQVAAFGSEAPARVVAQQLGTGGTETRVRVVDDGSGHKSWRVEVGDFSSAAEAQRYQRTFENRSGYSTVLVPTL